MIDLNLVVAEKLALLDRQLVEAKFTRDHAAAPTESASDKTRQNAEQLMDSLSDAKKKLELLRLSLIKLPPFKGVASVNTLVTLHTPLGTKEFLLVPEGLGGQTIDNVFLLSEKSPLAQAFLGGKPGHTFTFSGGSYRIVFVNPNN